MKVLVVGYGSMGRRRIRLLRELEKDASILCVDSNPERMRQAEEDGLIAFANLEDALAEAPELAFVCTSPGHHADIILQLVEAGLHVFTELNLTADRYDEMTERAARNGVTVFMSSTLLYRKQIEIVRELVGRQDKPLTYIYHVGQYLPDWHPWESYKDFFIGKKETSGVREILAIQLPWVVEAFGRVEALSAYRQKCTGLEIAFEDSAAVGFRHENGNIGVFVADVVCREATTKLEIFGEDLQIRWGGHNDDLFVLNIEKKEWEQVRAYASVEQIEGYSDNIIEDQYRDEIRDFLNVVYHGAQPRYSLKKDAYVLSLIDRIEAAL